MYVCACACVQVGFLWVGSRGRGSVIQAISGQFHKEKSYLLFLFVMITD